MVFGPRTSAESLADKGKYVEPRGLEPLTPCLQSDGVALGESR
jgi:hypothetical protein